MSKCVVYRHFDEAGVLLYVGISDKPSDRGRQHARSSDWTQYAVRLEGVWYASREEAVAAELRAIREEAPVFNIAEAPEGRWSRIERYVETRRTGVAYRRRDGEELITLREAAREQRVVSLTWRQLLRVRREPVEGFPSHAGRTWWLARLYSAEELEDWADGLGGSTLHCSRSELRDLRRWHRRRQRRRTHGERPGPRLTAQQWLDMHHWTADASRAES